MWCALQQHLSNIPTAVPSSINFFFFSLFLLFPFFIFIFLPVLLLCIQQFPTKGEEHNSALPETHRFYCLAQVSKLQMPLTRTPRWRTYTKLLGCLLKTHPTAPRFRSEIPKHHTPQGPPPPAVTRLGASASIETETNIPPPHPGSNDLC